MRSLSFAPEDLLRKRLCTKICSDAPVSEYSLDEFHRVARDLSGTKWCKPSVNSRWFSEDVQEVTMKRGSQILFSIQLLLAIPENVLRLITFSRQPTLRQSIPLSEISFFYGIML
jgi:hypothetical protein